MKNLFALWLLLGVAPFAGAQEPSPEPSPVAPGEPFLERAPEFSMWTMTKKSAPDPQDKATPAASPAKTSRTSAKTPSTNKTEAARLAASTEKTTIITKTKTIRHERTSGGGSEDSERWCLPGIQVSVQGEGEAIVSLPGSAESAYTDYSETDFDGLKWLKASNFKRIEQVNEQECFVFKDKVKGMGHDPAASTECIACINTATRLPVTLQIGEDLYSFQFGIAPTAMLKPPQKVAAKVENWKKSVEESSLTPAAP